MMVAQLKCVACGGWFLSGTEWADNCPKCAGAPCAPTEGAAPTALEHVERLKAARRAELAARRAAEERKAFEEEEKRRLAWERDVAAALAELGVEWLAPFRGTDRAPYTSHTSTVREAAFNLPGHRTLLLRLREVKHYDPTWKACVDLNWKMPWSVATGTAVTDCETLADALLAAELRPGETDEV